MVSASDLQFRNLYHCLRITSFADEIYSSHSTSVHPEEIDPGNRTKIGFIHILGLPAMGKTFIEMELVLITVNNGYTL